MKLSDVMLRALELYGRIATGDIPTHAAHAYPTTGTTAALVGRGLLTPAHEKWEHTPTEAGWAVLTERTSYNPDVRRVFNIGDAHTLAIEERNRRDVDTRYARVMDYMSTLNRTKTGLNMRPAEKWAAWLLSEHVEALEEDRARNREVRLHVGFNDAGYSPNNEPFCTTSVRDAADALLADMFRTLEHLGDACDHPTMIETCEWCRTYRAAEQAYEQATKELNAMTRVPLTGYAVAMPDGRPLPAIHWIEHVEIDHRKCNVDN